MAKRLDRSKLFFGQLAGGQKPDDYKSTMSGFYGGVGKEQTGAVQKIGQGVEQATAGLAGNLGLTQTVDEGSPTKVNTTLTKGGPFAVTATPGQPPPATPPTPGDVVSGGAGSDKIGGVGGESAAPAAGAPQPPAAPQQPSVPPKITIRDKKDGERDEDYLKYLSDTLTAAGSSVEEWKNSGEDAEEFINAILKKNREAAEKSMSDAEKRLTEGKLGQRAQASELEKQAQSYQNVLASEPGTSNVKALAMLSQFYDPKYLALESGLRQGEMALGRQEAVGNVEAMQRAEAARGAAISEYGKQSKELGQELMGKIGEQEESKRKEFKDFYKTGKEEAEAAEKSAGGKIKETEAAIEKTAQEELTAVGKELKDDPTYTSLENIINAISGRDGKNWLNTRGNEVFRPIRQEMLSLSEKADVIAKDPQLSTKEKTKRLKEIKGKVKAVRGRMAGELAAFLGDTNTQSGDALDAAEQIVAAGLIDDLTTEQKMTIIGRLYSDQGPRQDEKRQRIYSAFGGGSLESARNQARDRSDLSYNINI